MKHPAIREVFNYWNALRAGRAAPERSDIEPSAIRGVLADTFMLAADPSRDYPFRVAGTRVCALFGREIKGEAFLDLFWRETRDEVRRLMTVIAHETVGVVASASELAGIGHKPKFELLLLPLRHHGSTDARVLGALASSEPSDWLGTRVVSDLLPGSYRFLGGGDICAAIAQAHQGRMRHGLLVYDGGQA